MMSLIDEVFATRNDPDQIQVSSAQLKKLNKIHPSTLCEIADDNGPLIWVLLIPTTLKVMNDFIEGKITEKGILDNTSINEKYEAIYLCSATSLPEIRGKGKTKALCMSAITSIQNEHPIKHLFVWPFTKEGEALAKSIANASSLNLTVK